VTSIRVSVENRKWLKETLKAANKKENGRSIKLDDLLQVCRSKITSEDIEVLRNRSLTNEDRKELFASQPLGIAGFTLFSSLDFSIAKNIWSGRLGQTRFR
jgi:hypothetical protein